MLSHSDRTRVIADGYTGRIFTRGAFLVDGFVRGAWKIVRNGAKASLLIEPFEFLSKPDTEAIAGEGAKLLGFAAGKQGGRRSSHHLQNEGKTSRIAVSSATPRMNRLPNLLLWTKATVENHRGQMG